MFDLNKNYFDLLGIPQEFVIDQDKLNQNYINLQQLFHPDKQVNKANAEKILMLEYSAKLNHIYQVLKDNKKRAEYLLSLHAVIVNTDDSNIKPDMVMLADILEMSEAMDHTQIKQEIQECWDIFIENYPTDLQKAAQAMIKLQYLSKI